ncbi:MAG: hypothetical protein GWN13_03755 [Phycisphaerae bacterium]|nr:hypothetical protein [Phycisphaerae bacterium]
MFNKMDGRQGNAEDAFSDFIPRIVLERIVAEHGGIGMTPDDAERFLGQVGAEDAIFTLVCLKVETFRMRMDKVLNGFTRYAANPSEQDALAMAENAQNIFHEFMELCQALGLVESQRILVVTDEDV